MKLYEHKKDVSDTSQVSIIFVFHNVHPFSCQMSTRDILPSVPIPFKEYDKTITLLEFRSIMAGTS